MIAPILDFFHEFFVVYSSVVTSIGIFSSLWIVLRAELYSLGVRLFSIFFCAFIIMHYFENAYGQLMICTVSMNDFAAEPLINSLLHNYTEYTVFLGFTILNVFRLYKLAPEYKTNDKMHNCPLVNRRLKERKERKEEQGKE